MYQKYKNKIRIIAKQVGVGIIIFGIVFPYNILTVLADAVPVYDEVLNEERLPQNNSSVVSGTSSLMQMLGEIVAPIYHLATPGSNLTYDIYRYLMKHTEDELGIDKDFFRRMKQKVDAPTVDIIFTPTNPKIGERVTAFAIPHGFRNNKERLYYTWYIVHDPKGKGGYDSSLNVQNGRNEAMAIIARGGYDKELFGDSDNDDNNRDAYDASYGGDDGKGKQAISKECTEECECLKQMTMMGGEITKGCFDDRGELLYNKTEEYDEVKSDRGEESAKIGRGVVNSEFISRCYRHNFGGQSADKVNDLSGRDLIIKCKHAFGDKVGDDKLTFDATAENIWGTNKGNPDTDGDGIIDEADLAGLGQDEFTWIYRKGDKVSVAIEGTSNIMINEGTTARLRYENTDSTREDDKKDISPVLEKGVESWYKTERDTCEDAKDTCLAEKGDSETYTKVSDRLPADSECTQVYSDCMKELWEHKRSDDNDEDAFGDMTGYYKIMWAAPGICTDKTQKEASKDWCDTKEDIGFQYLKLYDPVERGRELLEVSVNVSPKNPQFKESGIDMVEDFSVTHSDSTDMIVASASVVSKDYINPDYLYYKWSVWSCNPDDFDSCNDITNTVDFKSREEGLGLRDIGFYPTNGIFAFGNRALLKIGVIVKKHKNSVMSSPGVNGEYTKQIFSNEKKNISREDRYTQKYAYTASKLVEVSKHNLNIKLYQAKAIKGGSWQKGKEICGEGSEKDVYRKICPVYQYQVLMAEVENAGEAISWQLNGKNIGPTLNNKNNQNPNSTTIFFPITGVDGELGTIKATSETKNKEGTWEDDNISEARVFSIHRPMAKILDKEGALDANSIQRAYAGAYANSKGYYSEYKNEELWWIAAWRGIPFNERKGIVDIPVTVIPRYLQEEVDGVHLILQSYANTKAMGNLANESNSVFEKVKFNNDKDKELNRFRIRTIRQFSDEYKIALKQSFGVAPLDELVDDLKIKVKAISDERYLKATGKTMALNMSQKTGKVFASTIQNAPAYLVFILRLAVSFVLVAMVTFGLIRTTRKIS